MGGWGGWGVIETGLVMMHPIGGSTRTNEASIGIVVGVGGENGGEGV
jgi:hypothetical protein